LLPTKDRRDGGTLEDFGDTGAVKRSSMICSIFTMRLSSGFAPQHSRNVAGKRLLIALDAMKRYSEMSRKASEWKPQRRALLGTECFALGGQHFAELPKSWVRPNHCVRFIDDGETKNAGMKSTAPRFHGPRTRR